MGKQKKQSAASSAGATATIAPVTVETLVAGDGTMPNAGDAVTVHYIGTLVKDGSMFDSSRAKKTPFSFKLGGSGVIKGWNLGVAQMSKGQRAKLTIAAAAAYGSRGCIDKANASGTGVIPPNADLHFEIELLDINFRVTLARYKATLDAWIATKLDAFDKDGEARAPLEATHGTREGYLAHLESTTARKYEAERAKRFMAVGIDPSTMPDDGLAAVTKAMGEASVADGKETTASSAASEGKPPTAAPAPAPAAAQPLQFDERFAAYKVEPNDEEEAVSPNFPRSLHNAAELFVHLGHRESAARLHGCVSRAMATLEAGPDGKSGQKVGRACVCWGCGYVGLPKNAAQCSEKAPKPAGVCAGCGESAQTNFVRLVQSGKTLPWIEAAMLDAEEAAKASEAAARAEGAARAAEVS